MKKPIAAIYDTEHNTSLLKFEGGVTARYYMRGAISWPTKVQSANVAVPGYALVAGQQIGPDHTIKRMVIFEEFQFWNLSSTLSLDKKTYKDGLHEWLNGMWKRYRCGTYYCAGDRDSHLRYALLLRRERLLDFRPVFSYMAHATEEVTYADSIIIRESKRNGWEIVEDNGSELMNQMEGGIDETKRFALASARALFCGFEQSPWRLPADYGRQPQLVWYR